MPPPLKIYRYATGKRVLFQRMSEIMLLLRPILNPRGNDYLLIGHISAAEAFVY